jgi:uncharacterized protein
MLLRPIFLAVAVALMAFPALSREASEHDREGTFAVQGDGVYVTAPDSAEISASIASRADDLKDAQNDARAKMAKGDAALESLRAKGLVVDEKTYHVMQQEQPLAPGSNAPPKRFWEASGDYRLKVAPLAEINPIVTALVDAGFEIHNVGFAVNDPRAAMNEARKDAARDAQERAKAYAEALGVKLGQIYSLTDGGAANIAAMAALPMRKAFNDAPAIKIDVPKTLTFNATVQIVWRIAGAPQE